MIGLDESTYEAYCLDEAVVYFGISLQNMLEEAGSKPSKEERKSAAARERVIGKVFGDKKQGSGFADPAVMFGTPKKEPTKEQ